MIGYLFFNKIIAGVLLMPLGYFYYKKNKSKHVHKKKTQLMIQFCDGMEAISISMQAGKSIEKAFVHVIEEMIQLYGENSMIVKELRYIVLKESLGISIEESLKEFAEKTKIEEIVNFAEVFAIAKRSDGNIIKIISFTTKRIRENIEMNREMVTAIASVISEINVMKFMPIALIIFLRITSPGYFDAVYNSSFGIMSMLAILFVYFIVIIIIEVMKNRICEKG